MSKFALPTKEMSVEEKIAFLNQPISALTKEDLEDIAQTVNKKMADGINPMSGIGAWSINGGVKALAAFVAASLLSVADGYDPNVDGVPSSTPTSPPTSTPTSTPTSNYSSPTTSPTILSTLLSTLNSTANSTFSNSSYPTSQPSGQPTFNPTDISDGGHHHHGRSVEDALIITGIVLGVALVVVGCCIVGYFNCCKSEENKVLPGNLTTGPKTLKLTSHKPAGADLEEGNSQALTFEPYPDLIGDSHDAYGYTPVQQNTRIVPAPTVTLPTTQNNRPVSSNRAATTENGKY